MKTSFCRPARALLGHTEPSEVTRSRPQLAFFLSERPRVEFQGLARANWLKGQKFVESFERCKNAEMACSAVLLTSELIPARPSSAPRMFNALPCLFPSFFGGRRRALPGRVRFLALNDAID